MSNFERAILESRRVVRLRFDSLWCLPQSFNGELVERLTRQTFGACGLLFQLVDPAHDPALELNGQFETNALVPDVVSLASRRGELRAGCHTG
jgi:hypothetical protein